MGWIGLSVPLLDMALDTPGGAHTHTHDFW